MGLVMRPSPLQVLWIMVGEYDCFDVECIEWQGLLTSGLGISGACGGHDCSIKRELKDNEYR